MKKLVFGLIAMFLFTSLSFGQTFEQSVAIKLGSRITTKEGGTSKSARSITLSNFNESYKLLSVYVLNGVDFTDDGKYNDLRAGDGIYTSVQLLPNPRGTSSVGSYLISDDFKYMENLISSTSKIKIGCKIRHVRSGFSILGTNCATNCCGCTEFYDCEISIEIEW
ncbi:hypothetical protein [Flavobacterium sp.]|uniref:hypothetical protein n=1 Tax=Flavobacterium sp. TaxID=239 RepID=UPI002B4B93F6|nr:hypothetical protein [Flavobacterium sp.]HLP63210.1 hypothetical protein [Flavobacterium sp.]